MKLSDNELPSKKCDLIVEMLVRLAENENYILIHEQKKILSDRDYAKRFRRTKYWFG